MNSFSKSGLFVGCVALFLGASLLTAQAETTQSDASKLPLKTNPVIVPAENTPYIPVPEPSSTSLVLMSAGLAGLALRLRRKA